MDKSKLFESCTTKAEVMKRMFELSENPDITRAELVKASANRMAELKSSAPVLLEIKKISIPEIPTNVDISSIPVECVVQDKFINKIKFKKDGTMVWCEHLS